MLPLLAATALFACGTTADDGQEGSGGSTYNGPGSGGQSGVGRTTTGVGGVNPGAGGANPGAGGATRGAAGTGTSAGGAGGSGTRVPDGGVAGRQGGAGSSGQGGANGTGGIPGRGGAANVDGGPVPDGAVGAGGSATDGGSSIVGATPPMGWNSWNKFGCNNLNETVIKQVADVFVSSGMKAVGYQYVNLDDCWMDGRDSSGQLKWSTSRFPSGIPSLAEYVHGKGLKLGIYETPNTATCAGIYGPITRTIGVGSYQHETTDAQTFASWGIDYLKFDKCTGDVSRFAVMRDALRATGRAIFYSINPADGTACTPVPGKTNTCPIDVVNIANMWRISFDINASWSSVTSILDQNQDLYPYAGPGHWNDPDMLEVGNAGLSDTEARAHFSMWAVMAAPLIAGNDLTAMSATTKETLTNSEVIAVDQDPMGIQGKIVATPGTNLQVWSKTLSGTNARAVVLLNRGSQTASIQVQWSALGIPGGAATVRDLWSHTDLGSFTDSYTASSVPGHGVVMLRISAP